MSMKNRLNTKEITTDVLIIGGGTAGCYAALVLSEQKAGKVLIAEKANIKRSGCLAAGVNAINAYIVLRLAAFYNVGIDGVDTCCKTAASFDICFFCDQHLAGFLF